MAPSFNSETQVLWYGPTAHCHAGPRNDREYILWPAVAYRVVAPDAAPGVLNLLQKAVLIALTARPLIPEELGALFGLDPGLMGLVLDELQMMGCIGQDQGIKIRGEGALEREFDASARLMPAWVFRDPWSGELWPELTPKLEPAKLLWDESGWPELDLGTSGSPWRQRTWWQVPPPGFVQMTPGPSEILRASNGHERRKRKARHTVLFEEDYVPDETREVGLLERLTCIEPTPYPVFLATFLYIPHEGPEDGMPWHACDPFGRGSDPLFKQRITRTAEQDKNLRGVLDRLIRRSLVDNYKKFQGMVASTAEIAQRTLIQLLTDEVKTSGVANPLREVLEAWQELESIVDGESSWRQRAVLSCCRRSLERLLAGLKQEWPMEGVHLKLPEDPETKQAKLEGIAEELGLEVPLPSSLTSVNRGKVESVCDHDNAWSLRPLMVATMLAAEGTPEHPLRQAATDMPDLLRQLNMVAAHAGRQAHEGSDEIPGLAVVEQCIDQTIAVTGALLGLPARTLKQVRGER